MKLDLSSLEKALQTLDVALVAYQNEPNDLIRDACIQRFEYSFELLHKFISRYLELTEATPSEIDQMSFPNRIRLAYERGLLSQELTAWKGFREARNITSHAYDENKAKEIFAHI